MCSFGDASLNHSTAQGALNAAGYTAHQGMRLPLLFVCEDNGWGISVPSPTGWVESSLRARAGLRYEQVDGTDPIGVHDTTEELAEWVRTAGRPAVLHLRTVRFGGHAGTDVEASYRSARRHPGRSRTRPAAGHGRRAGRASGWPTGPELVERYLARRQARARPGRRPRRRTDVAQRRRGDRAAGPAPADRRRRAGRRRRPGRREGGVLRRPPAGGGGRARRWPSRSTAPSATCSPPTAARSSSARTSGPRAACTASPAGSSARPAPGGSSTRSSTSSRSSGSASASAVSGLLPIPEIQYLAYLHNAEDQLRGEAASLAVLLQRPVPQPDGRAHRRLRLPEGVRRPLPQRQRGRRAARHPRPRHRLARPPGRRRRRCCARARPRPMPTAR